MASPLIFTSAVWISELVAAVKFVQQRLGLL